MPKKKGIRGLLSSNLLRIREEKGYSLRELAARCEKADNSDLSKYEHGDTNIGLEKLDEIARALEVLAAELILPPEYEIRKKE
ncbi:helix-turn-helix transcriptional regulator [Chitinophaga niabensis]|uniref:helix-turn-helix domain-containing protein n=1 Tax=Chitinophaga niabensis TaxID=536979 RepID=UPI0031BB998A